MKRSDDGSHPMNLGFGDVPPRKKLVEQQNTTAQQQQQQETVPQQLQPPSRATTSRLSAPDTKLERPGGLQLPPLTGPRRSLNECQLRDSLEGDNPPMARPVALTFSPRPSTTTTTSGFSEVLDYVPGVTTGHVGLPTDVTGEISLDIPPDPIRSRPSSAVDSPSYVRSSMFVSEADEQLLLRDDEPYYGHDEMGDSDSDPEEPDQDQHQQHMLTMSMSMSMETKEQRRHRRARRRAKMSAAQRLTCSMHAGVMSPDADTSQRGFLDFQSRFPELCEGAVAAGAAGQMGDRSSHPVVAANRVGGGTGFSRMSPRLSSLSQPCLPLSSQGPTRILPFLYLGSQQDAMDHATLKKYGIRYVINLSISCPKPEFMQEGHFLRIPVNDSYQEKLLPYFEKAFSFLDEVRERNQAALIHCLAGISRSPTLAIAYIMRHLHMNSDEAYSYVKAKRPSISPNFNFMGQLLEFEKQQKLRRGREAREQLKQSMRKVLVPVRTVHIKKETTSRRHLLDSQSSAPMGVSQPISAKNAVGTTTTTTTELGTLPTTTTATTTTNAAAVAYCSGNKPGKACRLDATAIGGTDTISSSAAVQSDSETLAQVVFRRQHTFDNEVVVIRDDGEMMGEQGGVKQPINPSQSCTNNDDADRDSLLDEPALMRRSLSCPIKIHKSASETRLISGTTTTTSSTATANHRLPIVPDASPSHRPNAFGKREMRLKDQSNKPRIDDDDDRMQVDDASTQPASTTIDAGGDVLSQSFIAVQRPHAFAQSGGTSASTSGTMSARAAARRALNIPHAVCEDLPSPSTELSRKLSLEPTSAGAAPFPGPPLPSRATPSSGTTSTTAVNPFFSTMTGFPSRPIDVAADQPANANNSSTGCVSAGAGGVCAAMVPMCGSQQLSPSYTQSTPPEKLSPATAVIGDTNSPTAVGNAPVVLEQPTSATACPSENIGCSSAVNPLFPPQPTPTTTTTVFGRPAAPPVTAAGNVPKPQDMDCSSQDVHQSPPVIQVDRASDPSAASSNAASSSLTKRIADFIRKRSGGSSSLSPGVLSAGHKHQQQQAQQQQQHARPNQFVAPKSLTVDHLSSLQHTAPSTSTGAASSTQMFGTGLAPPPVKSKSESALLHTLCAVEQLDSPESGFVESPMDVQPAAPPYGKDPERESISSQSSLEITVN